MSRQLPISRLIILITLVPLLLSGCATPQSHPTALQLEALQVLTLPFHDFRVQVQQGWLDHPLPRNNQGIDYILGPVNIAAKWNSFEVVAAYDGNARAMCGSGAGQFVKIDHEVEVDGQVVRFRTYYGHLAEIAEPIKSHSCGPEETAVEPVFVKQGDIIGLAGGTGTDPEKCCCGCIHLHFSVYQPTDSAITYDPYGIETNRSAYYPGGDNTHAQPSTYYWTTNPPSYPQNSPLVIKELESASTLQAGSLITPNRLFLTVYAPSSPYVNDFSIRIGDREAHIVQETEIAGETGVYKLVVDPPSQMGPGTYDLSIRSGSFEATKAEAVRYSTAEEMDVVLVLDRSGSMLGQRLQDAQSAANQFVAFLKDSDQLGIASFATTATRDFPISQLTDTARQNAQATINNLRATGSTSIGAGMRAALEELRAHGDDSHPWTIVLLSDGEENRAPYANDVLPEIRGAGITVHTISLGSTANQELMRHIAEQTGGIHHHAPTSTQLGEIYGAIRTVIAQEQSIFAATGLVQKDAISEQAIAIDAFTSDAIFSVSWPGSDLDLTLIAPDGTRIDSDIAKDDPDIEFVSTGSLEFYRIRNVTSGQWRMMIEGVTVEKPGGEPYVARVSARTQLTLFTTLGKDVNLAQQPIQITALVADVAPITGATVEAAIISPTGIATSLELFDDGGHGDGVAGDGIYANTYHDAVEPGSYTVTVSASGSANNGDTFTRQDRSSILVIEDDMPQHDLHLLLSGPDSTHPLSTFSYTISYGNYGPAEVNDATILLELPDGMDYLSDTLGGSTLTADGLRIWRLPSMAKDSESSFSVSVSVGLSSLMGQSLTTSATIGQGSGQSIGDEPSPNDPDYTDNTDVVVTKTDLSFVVLGVVLAIVALGVAIWLARRSR